MIASTEKDLRYPIGKFQRPADITAELRGEWITQIGSLPAKLSRSVEGLNDGQLDTPYRPSGWTVRQVVHHVADSHINSYTRYRLALTEDTPRIKPYREAAWAELPDARILPVDVSLELLRALHARWDVLLRSMSPQQFERTFEHPEHGPMRLDVSTALYAWHSRHHVAHVVSLRERNDW